MHKRDKLCIALCDTLDGWGGEVGGRFRREGVYVYMELSHLVVQQKLTQHCKSAILQSKKKNYMVTKNAIFIHTLIYPEMTYEHIYATMH